ncbi:inositol monophosphatase family protein [Chloroflexota bacterium]
MNSNEDGLNTSNTPSLSFIKDLARKAGEIVRKGYALQHRVDYKSEIDLVTEIDHQSESFLISEIKQNFNNHNILAEESGQSPGNDSHQWYIDPLDGTVNYAHDIPIFCVSIAYAHNSIVQLGVVYDPMRDECYGAQRGKGAWLNGKPLHASDVTELGKSLLVTGFPYDTWNTPKDNTQNFIHFAKMTQGVRRLGSAALDLCYVAAGRFDGFWELSLQPWDVAAGGLIAEEAGATVTNISGGPDYISSPQSILASTPGLHKLMLEELEKNQQLTNKILNTKKA